MASWMIHLRVAQGIYEKLSLEHKTEFVMGNIAPDSGVPTADGTGFVPDAEVSHFRTVDENGIKDVHDDLFVTRYFIKERRENYNKREYAFYLWYWAHLLTDKLWASKIVYGAKEKYSDLFEQDNTDFWKKIKRDWYDLDFLYLKKPNKIDDGDIRIREHDRQRIIYITTELYEEKKHIINQQIVYKLK